MYQETKIKDDGGNGIYTVFYSPDFEYVNPIEYYSSITIARNISILKDILLLKYPDLKFELIEKYILEKEILEWDEKVKQILNTKIPVNFISILSATSKKEQINLLKGLSINPEQLLAFLFKSKTDYGYLFSQYTSEHHQNGLKIENMPKLVEIKDDKVSKVGNTTLTDGQLKQAVDHRKVVVAKLIDKEDEWHCLFLTYDSIRGKETWKGGQPHYHYISDKFGIPRAEVLNQLKSRIYNLGSLPHIDLVGYRDEK